MTLTTPTRTLTPTDQLFLGLQIRQWREAAGITLREVGRRIRIDASIVGLWECDHRPVPHVRVPALAAALEVTEDTLLAGARIQPGGYTHPVGAAEETAVVVPAFPPMGEREVPWWQKPCEVRITTIDEFCGGSSMSAPYVPLHPPFKAQAGPRPSPSHRSRPTVARVVHAEGA
jgi:transcriptional regulator with XRE-family HTH domain